jgi:hypothetical protein
MFVIIENRSVLWRRPVASTHASSNPFLRPLEEEKKRPRKEVKICKRKEMGTRYAFQIPLGNEYL